VAPFTSSRSAPADSPKRQPWSVKAGSTTETEIALSSPLSLRPISARDAQGQISAT